MRTSSSLSVSSGVAMGLTATAIAIAVILLASNFTTIDAQQQFSQPGEIENGTTEATIFQSTDDSFTIQVPQGWVIQDVNNTGSMFLEERTQGYGILAQLCPEEQQQGAAALSNTSGGIINSISSINASSCQVAQDVIHIIRYPDLDTRIVANNVTTNNTTTIDNILTHHLQKLQEVGYRSMQIVNSTDVTSNLIDPQTNETISTVPSKLVEMTYSTNSAPNETRIGHFVLTATDATAPNLGATKGYSVFYEGSSTTATAAEITTATASLPPPPAVGQVFDSFELIAVEAAEDDDDDDNGGGDDDDNDDNGGGDDDDNDDNGGGDDDDNDDNGGGDEGEDNEEGNPNEFDDCIVPPGMDPGDVGC